MATDIALSLRTTYIDFDNNYAHKANCIYDLCTFLCIFGCLFFKELNEKTGRKDIIKRV